MSAVAGTPNARTGAAEGAGPPASSGIGAAFVPRSGIVAMLVCLLLLTAAVFYSLWAFWPTALKVAAPASTGTPQSRQVHYLGLTTFTASTETLFFLVVGLAGALGGLIHTLRSFSMYVGTRRLRWSWIPFNLLLPVIGALGGTVFYLVFRAGLFSPSTSVQQASPFGFAAIAALVGLFSEQAMEKLRQLAKEMFAEAPKYEPDHFEPAAGGAGGSTQGSDGGTAAGTGQG